jgi:hypothetical protein
MVHKVHDDNDGVGRLGCEKKRGRSLPYVDAKLLAKKEVLEERW